MLKILSIIYAKAGDYMDENIKNKYAQIHTNIKQREDNAIEIVQKVSKMPDCDKRHELLKQLNGEVCSLTQMTIDVISDLLKI